MTVLDCTAAAAAAGVTAHILLSQSHRRHPLWDKRGVGWWVALVVLDMGVAVGLLLGVLGPVDNLDGAAGVARALAVGVVGPLGLRTPVRRTRIRGRSVVGGFTVIYDWMRIPMDQHLEERIIRLRREDRARVYDRMTAQGWTAPSFARRLEEHLGDLQHNRDPGDLSQITKSFVAALTVPTEPEQLLGLIKVAIEERFSGPIEDCSARPPTSTELQGPTGVLKKRRRKSDPAHLDPTVTPPASTTPRGPDEGEGDAPKSSPRG
jgi:hypothetical protein